MNHTSDQHPWFVESRSSRDNPKRGWYIWRDPKNGKEPNNWEAVFGGKAWKYDERTGQYYLHLFTPEQPDLNWRNPQVREALFDECRFWLGRGVDGFRLDVAHGLVKPIDLPDNPIRFGLRGYDRQDHSKHWNRPETHVIWKEFRQLLNQYDDRMAVGEVEPAIAESYYGSGDDELHLAFNFALMRCGWDARAFYKVIVDWESKLPDGAWPCWVLNNHDNPRSITRYASGSVTDARATVAATLLLTLRGTPFLYYGEEIGMRNGKIPRHEILDPPGRKYWPLDRGRDGCRTPMQWNAAINAGFSTARPWLRVNPDYATRNVEAERHDPRALLNYYRSLIALRRESPALRGGTFRALNRPIDVFIYEREADGQRMLIALNFFSRPAMLQLEGAWQLRLSSVNRPMAAFAFPMQLMPNEAIILEKL